MPELKHESPMPCAKTRGSEPPPALEAEPRRARAVPKRRREEGFTADVKAYAVERFAAGGDAAQAARATEEHFASQHRVFRLPPRLIRAWQKTGAGDPVRFKANARGGCSKDTFSSFCFHRGLFVSGQRACLAARVVVGSRERFSGPPNVRA